jgi:hypothetical protein
MKTLIILFALFSAYGTVEAAVYKCNGNTYSQLPCGNSGPLIENVTIYSPTTAVPVEASRIRDNLPAPMSSSSQTMVQPPSATSNTPKDCTQEEKSLDAIKSTMRAGYPASMSNYYHDRLREANKNLLKCNGYGQDE